MSARRAQNPSFRNPPTEHRFRKGVSGNPRGRPRKGDTRTLPSASFGELFQTIAREPVHITINGEARKVSGEEAYIRSVQARAIKGEPRAMKIYGDLLTRYGGPVATQASHEDFLDALDHEPTLKAA